MHASYHPQIKENAKCESECMIIHPIIPLPLPYIKGPQGRMGSLLVRLVMVMLSLLSIPSAINAQGLVFGEKTYNFNYGLFGYFTENFVIENTSDKYIITIQNGDASGKKRVKNGKVVLNDLVIPLIQQNDVIQQEVRLKSKNLINVRLVGGDEGAFITIGIASLTNAGGRTIGTTTVTPNSTPAGVQLVVTVTSSITSPTVVPGSVSLERIDSSGSQVGSLGTLHDDGLNGDAVAGDKMFSILATILENTPGIVRLRVSAAFQGSLQRATSAPVMVNITGSATGITISVPNNNAYLNTQLVTVRGTVGDPAATVTVNGVSAPLSGSAFVTTVPLNEGPNTLTAVANNANGTTSTASSLVTLDTTPPRVDIYSPANNSVTTDATVSVTGLINDIVVGTVNSQQATVTVNGVPAQVLNRTFMATNVPLAMGGNTIQVRGVDRVGNSVTKTITLTRQSTTQTTLRIYSGNGQSGPIRSLLPAPLVAQLLNAAGQPIPNTPVIFRVINQDGTLSPNGASGSGISALAINTDAQGLATVRFFLSSRSGAGNNLVEASATGVLNTAVFSASATPATAGLIIVDNGNNQSGEIGQALPLPFVAVVTDGGFNRLGGVPVIFTVKGGGGNFAGQPTFTTTSDGDGRVMATLTLGPNAGISSNIVEASFTGNTGFPATFIASGLTPGPASATRISGVVLDNSNNPIPGVTMRLFQVSQGNNGNTPQQVAMPVQTNAQGQFTMQPVPVGVFKLMADGGTSQRSGIWPTIEYDLITVAGQNNTVGSPIYLPEILSNNRLCVSPTTGGTLTIPQAPGFSLTVAPGSAIFPGGSRTGCISVTPVNMDKVPMVPGFGQQPRFVVTIQPVGTHFTTPAAITIPNVDGMAPRAVTEMYSFDHDLASFVAIGTGTVSEDGSVIRSDPGVGVIKAGWHCGGNPNQTGPVAPLNLSVTPTMAIIAVDEELEITASGTPPLDGVYAWVVGSNLRIVNNPNCDGQETCKWKFKGMTPGTAITKVCFQCVTTGVSECKDIALTVMKIEISPLSMNVTESEDSLDFEVIIQPTDSSVTYKWLTGSSNGAWPTGAGNNPILNYSNPTGTRTKVHNTRWFAYPDDRRSSVTNSVSTYTINIEVAMNGKVLRPTVPARMRVIADATGLTSWPRFEGVNSIQTSSRNVNGKTEWYVSGQGGFTRASPIMKINVPTTSQFYNKVYIHESKHVTQWTLEAPWKDLFDANALYNTVLKNLISTTSEEDLRSQILRAILTKNAADHQVGMNTVCARELAAFALDRAVAPHYLEIDDSEVPGEYNCTP